MPVNAYTLCDPVPRKVLSGSKIDFDFFAQNFRYKSKFSYCVNCESKLSFFVGFQPPGPPPKGDLPHIWKTKTDITRKYFDFCGQIGATASAPRRKCEYQFRSRQSRTFN